MWLRTCCSLKTMLSKVLLKLGLEMKTDMLKSLSARGFAAVLIVICVGLVTACDSTSSDVENDARPFPVFDGGGFDGGGETQPNPEHDPTVTALERLQDTQSSVVYGRVVKVEPVLDRFNDIFVDDEWVEQTTCDASMIEPALRVRLHVEQASWDGGEGKEVLLGLHREKMRNPYPILRNDAPLTWSDDHTYFPKGAYLGATGKFNDEGTFVAHIPFFSVDDAGQVEVPASTPDAGSLEGYTLQDLVEGLHATREEAYERVTDAFGPLESACVEYSDPATDSSTPTGIDCDDDENASLDVCR